MASLTGIVPSAGHAVRLQPLPCSKEALPVGGRPVIEYVLERMAAAGCEDVRVVTRPEKADVAALAAEHAATVVAARPETLARSIAIGAEALDDDAIALVGFPDSIWWPDDGFTHLIREVEEGAVAALGLFRVDEPWRSDVVTLDGDGCVIGLDVKPSQPASEWIWGCLAARAWTLRGLPRRAWPGEHLRDLARRERVVGVRLAGAYLDVGTPRGLAGAETWIAGHAARA